MPWISKKELDTLRAVSKEYNDWIMFSSAGGDYDAFVQQHVTPNLAKESTPQRLPACSDDNWNCTFPECGCGR